MLNKITVRKKEQKISQINPTNIVHSNQPGIVAKRSLWSEMREAQLDSAGRMDRTHIATSFQATPRRSPWVLPGLPWARDLLGIIHALRRAPSSGAHVSHPLALSPLFVDLTLLDEYLVLC